MTREDVDDSSPPHHVTNNNTPTPYFQSLFSIFNSSRKI